MAELQCDANSQIFATTPSPPTSSANYRLFLQQQAAMKSQVDIVMIGDSLTHRWPQDLLTNAFPGQRILNLGVEGDRTQNALWRIDRYPTQNILPKTITVLLGTNDLGAMESVCEIKEGLIANINRIRSDWPSAHIILIGISKRGDGLSSRESDRLQINNLILSLAKSVGASFIDIDDVLQYHGGKNCQYFQKDKLHYTPDAYAALSAALQAIIK